MPKFSVSWTALALLAAAFPSPAAAGPSAVLVFRDPPGASVAEDGEFDFGSLSLEELMALEVAVTTTGRKVQPVQTTPAAVFVLSGEDIRRSGVTTLPDALRLVPGLQVARVNASSWAVSARGFNDAYARKLLVLIDGRSIYTPLFSGVYWDMHDLMLEDIERVEVVRGPGASLWGANAVNGVINIITKRSQDTQGTLVSNLVGTSERIASVRHGGALDSGVTYRVYARGLEHDGMSGVPTIDAEDRYRIGRMGVRLDGTPGERDSWTVIAEAFGGQNDAPTVVLTQEPPFFELRGQDVETWGGHALGRWTRVLSENNELTVQSYLDTFNRRARLSGEDRYTYDLDFQQRIGLSAHHEFIWGLGYRVSRGETKGSDALSWDPATRTDHLFSAFVQDELRLTENLRLVAGAKLEHNDYTQFEFQPNLRGIWTPSERQTVWGSISRAVRSPNAVDHDAFLPIAFEPGAPPTQIAVVGNPDFRSEILWAYELGWRSQIRHDLLLDTALFYNRYDDLRTFEPGDPSFDGTIVTVPLLASNELHGETWGAELAADWRPSARWRFKAAYGLLMQNLRTSPTSQDEVTAQTYEDSNPRHQGSLRAWHELARNWEVDTTLHLVEALSFGSVPGYARLDLRLGWNPVPGTRLTIGVLGLFHHDEPELASDYFGQRRDVETAAYFKLTCAF